MELDPGPLAIYLADRPEAIMIRCDDVVFKGANIYFELEGKVVAAFDAAVVKGFVRVDEKEGTPT